MKFRRRQEPIESAIAFEASILRHLEFRSVAFPLASEPDLAWYLKFWHKRIIANDPSLWVWWSLRALVENTGERLSDVEAEFLAIATSSSATARVDQSRWLGPEDAAWFDGLRQRILALESDAKRAAGIRAGLLTADYAMSFSPGAARLKRPLAGVFQDLCGLDRPPIPSNAQHVVTNLDPETFTSRARADLLYLPLPSPIGHSAWRFDHRGFYETWLRGSEELFDEMCADRRDRLGGEFSCKAKYFEALDRLLTAASQIHTWALLVREDGWLSLSDVTDVVSRFRHITAVYSRDFTDAVYGRRLHILVTD